MAAKASRGGLTMNPTSAELFAAMQALPFEIDFGWAHKICYKNVVAAQLKLDVLHG